MATTAEPLPRAGVHTHTAHTLTAIAPSERKARFRRTAHEKTKRKNTSLFKRYDLSGGLSFCPAETVQPDKAGQDVCSGLQL